MTGLDNSDGRPPQRRVQGTLRGGFTGGGQRRVQHPPPVRNQTQVPAPPPPRSRPADQPKR